MHLDELRDEINIELSLMKETVNELSALQKDLEENYPTIREKTAAGAFLAQFYGGVENVLKRFCKFHGIAIPKTETWHLDLFKMFCDPPTSPLPLLFTKELKASLAPFRKFRHVAHHGYGFQLEWERMLPGIELVEQIFNIFRESVLSFLKE